VSLPEGQDNRGFCMRFPSVRHSAALGFAGALLALTGCSSGLGRPVREVRVEPGTDGVQHVTITAHSFWFEPNPVVIKAHVPVELRVKNGALLIPHNLTCIAPQAGIQLDEGLGMFKDSETARFTVTAPGEYPFFCKKDHHSKKGMTGTLVAVP